MRLLEVEELKRKAELANAPLTLDASVVIELCTMAHECATMLRGCAPVILALAAVRNAVKRVDDVVALETQDSDLEGFLEDVDSVARAIVD